MGTTNYVWDPEIDGYLMETDETDATTATYTVEPTHYGRVVSQHTAGSTQTLHFDALGSTREITDESESVVATIMTDAWGVELALTQASAFPFRWVGELGYRHMGDTTRLYVRERVYLPATGRWTSADPLRLAVRSGDRVYARNSPVTHIDPSGLVAECLPTQPGVTWIQGRGTFHYISMQPTRKALNSVAMHIHWRPSGDSFLSADCCCCDSVGFVQILRLGYRSETAFGDLYARTAGWTSWHVDVLGPKGIVYDGASKYRDPCADNQFARTSSMFDDPFIERVPLARPLHASHTFETCAVCISGVEGQLFNNTASGDRVSGLTVYGCIKWRTSWWSRDSRMWSVNDTRRGSWQDGFWGEPTILSADGEGPSDIFIRTVLERRWREIRPRPKPSRSPPIYTTVPYPGNRPAPLK